MEQYKSKRYNTLYKVAEFVCNVILSPFQVHYEHIERLEPLKDKGFILLPKHQHWLDIPLETILLSRVNRKAYFLMKGTLPKLLKYVGGIPITRPNDITNGPDRERIVEEIKARTNYVYNEIISNLLYQNEIVVIYPEGTRNLNKKARPIKRVLEKLTSLKNSPIDFVPLDTCYYGNFQKGSEIIVTVGNSIRTNNSSELEQHLVDEVELFG